MTEHETEIARLMVERMTKAQQKQAAMHAEVCKRLSASTPQPVFRGRVKCPSPAQLGCTATVHRLVVCGLVEAGRLIPRSYGFTEAYEVVL